ncbi:hypothetical protein BASA81_011024 [Batrachochytrium salamandrivorans]|nr:hypothetical protein BASA81_011024 [Batrachochytrium salamandrivorans]
MKPGENCYESACRILKRELGFMLPPLEQNHVAMGGRFQGVGAYSYTWEMREQEPKTHGCADISVVLAIEVTPQEISQFKMDNQEYETHAWFEAMQVVEDTGKHPALRRSVADYIKTKEWAMLTSKLLENNNENKGEQADAKVGRALKQFMNKWADVDQLLLQEEKEDPKAKRPKIQE